ncbi:hypothetical protein OEA41_009719 [Lepraria neglecta]|uniref:SnoaL-like domain-containing protein n=1 Tax=Lepraria neglecta TaxID=209136 RepID=A0AAD9Z5F8_9LECA|nr:hypothetical protein OEA41_009719 [Lepraria neglecta]
MQFSNCLSFSLWLRFITPITTHNTHQSSPIPLPSSPSLPAPIPLPLLPSTYNPSTYPLSATPVAQILNTLSLYPLAIDGKNFSALTLVFTNDIIANYSPPIGVVSGLSNVNAVLQESLAPVDTQHSYGTQAVKLMGEAQARSLSYFTASQFGRGEYYGEDTWVKVSDDEWKINTRNLVYMGPNIGNISVFTPRS